MNNFRNTLLALITVSLTLGYIWYGNRTVAPETAVWDDVRAEALADGYRLISTDDLWPQYEADPESLFLVDTRQEWEYRSGHIEGAIKSWRKAPMFQKPNLKKSSADNSVCRNRSKKAFLEERDESGAINWKELRVI